MNLKSLPFQISAVCFIAFLLSVALKVNGDVRFVSKEGSADSPFLSWKSAARDLESALDTANDGDVILLAPGTYTVSRTMVIRKNVTIQGGSGSHGLVILDGSDAPREGYCFDVQSPRAIISGLTITNFGGGIKFNHREGTSAVARSCVIVRNEGHGIFFNHGGCAKNCTIAFNGGAGLYAYDMGGGGDSPSNLILYKNGKGFVRQSANIELKNSYTSDPLFVSDEDFRLSPDSPCIDTGKNEKWMVEALDAGGSPRIQNEVVDIGAFEFTTAATAILKSLIEPIEKYAKPKFQAPSADAAEKAIESYLAEIEEIEQVAAQRRADAKSRLRTALKELVQFEKQSGPRFLGMLGSYYGHQGRIPFIMLSVPNGENALGERFRNAVNDAKFETPIQLYKFESRGHVSIPKDGTYRLQVSRAADIKLNDRLYRVGAKVAGQRPYADIQLKSGVYKVSFSVGNNGGQLGYSNVQIIDNQSEKSLPIFVYQSELDQFQNDLSLGVRLCETTGWTREENKLKD